MLRCESEQTNPNGATCKGDSDCPGDEKCVPPSMRQDSVSYQFLNVLEYLNWAEQLKKEDPDVLVMCHGTEDYYNWVEALAVSQYTPKAAFHLVMGFAGTLHSLGKFTAFWQTRIGNGQLRRRAFHCHRLDVALDVVPQQPRLNVTEVIAWGQRLAAVARNLLTGRRVVALHLLLERSGRRG